MNPISQLSFEGNSIRDSSIDISGRINHKMNEMYKDDYAATRMTGVWSDLHVHYHYGEVFNLFQGSENEFN